ncbi:hypothetical protein [Pseudacidovorax intermedius]|uniref:hypothetical protein n=1 Tax=Pseudacidovorax intermedius TaxID=433924 RepID=UPI000734FF85|nr:hypothetical protein [Pseudacidovorax intermedius]
MYVSADVLVVEGSGATLPSVDAVNADLERMREAMSAADAAIEAWRKRAEEEQARADELAEKLRAAEAARDAAMQDADALRAQLKPPEGGADRAALEAEATALGVQFRSNISDETLAARIAEAKAAK